MPVNPTTVASTLAALLAFGAWTVAAHVVFSDTTPTRLAMLFAWLPVGVTALWLARRSRRRALWYVAVAVATVALLLIDPVRRLDASLVYQLQYLAMQAALAVLFGRTLVRGHVPLVTRFARLLHGELPLPMERYTRAVTFAWTAFFVGMGMIAVALHGLASREAWSAFVNLLTLPCVLLMFVAEYAVRRMRFPDFQHSSLLDGARAFRRAFGPHDPPP